MSARGSARVGEALGAVVPVALIVAVGFASGGYGTIARSVLAIGLWVVVLGAVVAGVAAATAPTLLAAAALGAYAAWSGLSGVWGASAERAFLEFDRVALFLGVLVCVATLVRRRNVERFADGIAAGIVVLALVALASRFLPGDFPAARPMRFAWGVQTRLNYPLGYWTGLGVLVALSLPLLLRTAVASRPRLLRGAAVGSLPPLAVVLYLTSARLGFAVAALAVGAFFALAPRWATIGAVAVGGAASAGAVAFVASRPALVDGPFSSTDGIPAALVVGGCAAAAALAYGGAVGRLRAPGRLSRPLRNAVVVAAVVLVAAAVALAHPERRLHAFASTPANFNSLGVQQHLLTTSSNGRWQLWTSAAHEWEANPVLGGGAGSFETWWARHGSVAYARDAHSLYLEAAGEVGLVGLVLIVAGLLVGPFAVVSALRRRPDASARVTIAAVGASFIAWLAAAGVDWMWEFTIVSLVGIACLGLLVGPLWLSTPGAAGRRAAIAAGAAALVVLAAQLIVLLVAVEIRSSRAAAARGDLTGAARAAHTAHRLEPWASSPYLQWALVDAAAGRLGAARTHILAAIDRDPADWRLRLVAGRIERRRGDFRAARNQFSEAQRLRPAVRIVPSR